MSSDRSSLERLQQYEDEYQRFRDLFDGLDDVEEEQLAALQRVEGVIQKIRDNLNLREQDQGATQSDAAPRQADALTAEPTRSGLASIADAAARPEAKLAAGFSRKGASEGVSQRVTAAVDKSVLDRVSPPDLGGDDDDSFDIPTPIGGVKIPRPKVQKCKIILINDTDKPVTMISGSEKHAKGSGFETLPPHEVPADDKEHEFVATGPKTVRLIGCKGQMAFQIDDETRWEIKWHNPPFDFNLARPPKGSAKVVGGNASKYVTIDDNGTGDVAEFRYILRLKDAPVVDPEKPDPETPDPETPDPETPDPQVPGGPDQQASCRVSVTNETQSVLRLADQGHDRGDFMTFPDRTLQPGATTDFLSVETPNAEDDGCAGFLLWEVEGSECTWRVTWDNPEQQKNTTTSELSGAAKADFRELDQIAQGEENVPVSFTISGTGDPSTPGTEPPSTEPVSFAVVVFDKATGEPISSANVELGDQSRVTGPPGRAGFSLPAGKHPYHVEAGEYTPESGTTEVTADGELRVELSTGGGGDAQREGLTVLVTDFDTGEVIEGADVSVGDQADTSSSNGLATVELPVGGHRYRVSKEGYDAEEGNHEIVEGDNPELEVELVRQEGPREGLTVLVREKESGDSIEGAEVSVGDQSDTSSSNGLATVELPVGEHDYEASADGFKTEHGVVEVIEGDNPELIIEMTREDNGDLETLTVEVVDAETSSPIAGADVIVDGNAERTDAAGVASVQVKPGTYHLTVSAEGYDPESGPIDVIAGDDNHIVAELTPIPAGASLSFTVMDGESGDPISDANVVVDGQSAQTDATGSAAFELEAGTHRYLVTKDGYQDLSDDVDVVADTPNYVYVELLREPDFAPPEEAKQPTLRKGDESSDGWVEYLQNLLNKYLGPGTVQVNGAFDDATLAAVERFQEETDCKVDGIVGNQTWSALRKGPREPIGTDQREPHTFVEEGAEARWATEKTDFVSYDESKDELRMIAFSVGDTPLESAFATVRITSGVTNRSQTSKVSLGPPAGPAPTGSGQIHEVVISDVVARFESGTHNIEAYLDEELGGDLWEGQVECGQPADNVDEGGNEVGGPDAGPFQPVPEAELPDAAEPQGIRPQAGQDDSVIRRLGDAADKGMDRVGRVADKLTHLMGKGMDRIGRHSGRGFNISVDAIGDGIKGVGQIMGRGLTSVGDEVEGPLGAGLDAMAEVIEGATDQIDQGLDRLGQLADDMSSEGLDEAGDMVESVGDVVRKGMDRLGNKIRRASRVADAGADQASELLKDGLSELSDAVQAAHEKLEQLAREARGRGGDSPS